MNTFKAIVLCSSAFLLMVAVIFSTVNDKTPAEIAVEQLNEQNGIGDTEVSKNQTGIPTDNLSGEKIGWGLGKARNESGQPLDAVNAQAKYSDLGGIFIYPETANTMHLTFDLGYENGYTSTILDVLKQNNVKGIFFITGDYLEKEPELVERIIADGHILANHTVEHLTIPDISIEEATDDVMNLHDSVLQQFGYDMSLFRFPKGEFSEKTLMHLQNLGYKSMFWSFAYLDWEVDNQPDPKQSLDKLISAAHSGAIYLLHTVSETNSIILDEFIKSVKAKGFVFEKLSLSSTNDIIY